MIAALAFARRYWRFAAIGILVLLLGIQTVRRNHAAEQRDTAIAGRAVDRAAYKHAQETARANALAAAAKKDAENAKRTEEADGRYADLSKQFRTLGLRYAAAQSAARHSDLPAAAGSAESTDGTGSAAVVSQTDILICADNTARLVAAHEWAVSLTEANE